MRIAQLQPNRIVRIGNVVWKFAGSVTVTGQWRSIFVQHAFQSEAGVGYRNFLIVVQIVAGCSAERVANTFIDIFQHILYLAPVAAIEVALKAFSITISFAIGYGDTEYLSEAVHIFRAIIQHIKTFIPRQAILENIYTNLRPVVAVISFEIAQCVGRLIPIDARHQRIVSRSHIGDINPLARQIAFISIATSGRNALIVAGICFGFAIVAKKVEYTKPVFKADRNFFAGSI